MVNGGDVLVKNVRVKQREEVVCANVTLLWQMDGKSEKYNDCEYPLVDFKEVLK
jgi:hypothetical protein